MVVTSFLDRRTELLSTAVLANYTVGDTSKEGILTHCAAQKVGSWGGRQN